MTDDEYFALEKLINKRGAAAMAALLRSEKPLTHEARERLAQWLEKKNNGRPKLLYLKRMERDGKIIITFNNLIKSDKYESAIKKTADELNVSEGEVKRVLAEENRDTGEIVPPL